MVNLDVKTAQGRRGAHSHKKRYIVIFSHSGAFSSSRFGYGQFGCQNCPGEEGGAHPQKKLSIESFRIFFFIITLWVWSIWMSKLESPPGKWEIYQYHSNRRGLRSADDSTRLHVPRSRNTFSDKCFTHCALTIWNELPLELRNTKSLTLFKRKLKTHLFPK